MGKNVFTVDHEKQDGRVVAVNYGDFIRVLERRVGLPIAPGYHVLDGVIPPDLSAPRSPARYGCPPGEACALCTGSSNCGGGPPPLAEAPLAIGVAEMRTILVKQSVVVAPSAPEGTCLIDSAGDATLRVPVFDEPPDTDLSAKLSDYRRAAALEDQAMAFHVYQITQVTGASSELAQLRGKLIAVPVLFGAAQAVVGLRRLG